jgi:hypothetical protein
MNDVWMHALRRDPPTEFKEQLRRRLREHEACVPWRWRQQRC